MASDYTGYKNVGRGHDPAGQYRPVCSNIKTLRMVRCPAEAGLRPTFYFTFVRIGAARTVTTAVRIISGTMYMPLYTME